MLVPITLPHANVKTYVVKNNQLIGPTTINVTDAVEEAISVKRGDHLLSEQGKKTSADKSEIEVVELEKEAELDGIAVAHELPAAKDDEVVHDQHREGGAVCGEVGLGLDEFKVFSMVTVDGHIGFVEDGPQCEAERSVNCRPAYFEPVGVFDSCHCVRWRWRG
jgi:hypothetical protein